LAADIPRSSYLDLSMARDRGLKMGCRVNPNIVLPAVAAEEAAMTSQVFFEQPAFHHIR
jgi:hypothetical protein